MNVVTEFAKDAAVTALTTYGIVALATVVFPALGPASALWLVVPVMFAVQLGLKLAFSRDADGRLKRVTDS